MQYLFQIPSLHQGHYNQGSGGIQTFLNCLYKYTATSTIRDVP